MPDVHCTPLPNLWGLPLANSQSKHFADKRFGLGDSSPSSPTGFSSASSTASDHRRSQLSSAGGSPPTPGTNGSIPASMRHGSKVLPKVSTSPALFPNSKENSIWWPSSSASSSSVSQGTTTPSTNNAVPYNMLFNTPQTGSRSGMSGFGVSRGSAPLRPPGVDDVLISPASPPMVTPIGFGSGSGANYNGGNFGGQTAGGHANGGNFGGPAGADRSNGGNLTGQSGAGHSNGGNLSGQAGTTHSNGGGFHPFQQNSNNAAMHFNRGLGIEGNSTVHGHGLPQTSAAPMLQRHQSLPLHQPQPSHFVYYDMNPTDEHSGYGPMARRTPMAIATTVPSSPCRDEVFGSNTTVISSHRGSTLSAASSTTSIVSGDGKVGLLMSPVSTPNNAGHRINNNGSNSQRSSTSSSSSSTQKRKGNAKNAINTDLYKTELCSSYMTSGGNCPYGAKCQFAHGERELKIVDRPPKWRSKPCQNWIKNGMCSYNDRCCFRHDM